jgi:hypothetical protein
MLSVYQKGVPLLAPRCVIIVKILSLTFKKITFNAKN